MNGKTVFDFVRNGKGFMSFPVADPRDFEGGCGG
jgi:hypothetical protein